MNGCMARLPTDGVFGTVQAAARVFIFQALSAWTVLESTGQTEQLAPDFQTWLRSILEGEEPHVRRVSSVKVSIPEALTAPTPHSSRRRGLAPGGDLFVAPPVAVQDRGAAAELLPAQDDHVDSTSGRARSAAPGAPSSRRRSGSSPSRRTGRARCPGSCSSCGSPARPAPPASWSGAGRSAPACRRTRRRPGPARRTSSGRALASSRTGSARTGADNRRGRG